MKKVLIALDYSPTAQRIAERGYDLAKAMNAQTILLHVISGPGYYSSLNYSPIMGFEGFSVDTIESDTAGELRRSVEDFLEKSKRYLGDEMIETVVRNGEPGEAILETAEELEADIIVIGTHSRSSLERLLVGSVAENILHHSLIPLFIVPTKEPTAER